MKKLAKLLCSSAVILNMASTNANAGHEHNANIPVTSNLSVSYDYMYMDMNGLRDGTKDVSTAEVLANGYMMAPSKMTMQTHRIGAAYAVTPTTTISGYVPYNIKDMEHEDGMGVMKMKSEGLGDIRVQGNTKLDENFRVYYGLNIPTGSIKEKEDGTRLEYMMQHGSGTYDPVIGASYNITHGKINYTADASAIFRLYDNSEDYRLGNEYNASVGMNGQINRRVTGTVRLDGKIWENIEGADASFMPMMSPSADADKQGGARVDAVIGLGFKPAETVAIGAEIAVPVYQNLEGPQLETDSHIMVNLQKSL